MPVRLLLDNHAQDLWISQLQKDTDNLEWTHVGVKNNWKAKAQY